MIVLLDLGNTRIKAGWVDPASGRRESRLLALAHDAGARIPGWLKDQGVHPQGVFAVSVAGQQRDEGIQALFQSSFGLNIRWIHSERQTAGVVNAYEPAGQLGDDRWAAMLGLAQAGPDDGLARLLGNFGTATTLDTLCPRPGTAGTAGWTYEGGLILPGPEMMRSALAQGTARLPKAEGQATAFPRNTHQAITSGIAAAQAGALVRQWLAVLDRHGQAPHIYCSGGGWPQVQDEAARLLARAARLAGQAKPCIRFLATPVLDGLASLAMAWAGTQAPGQGSKP